ncbi:hypothetical protein GN956_G19522 [Arapaima gigas]
MVGRRSLAGSPFWLKNNLNYDHYKKKGSLGVMGITESGREDTVTYGLLSSYMTVTASVCNTELDAV